MKTFVPKKQQVIDSKKWYLIDAKGIRLGRLATVVAGLIYGKNKPEYVDFLNVGDYVVVINAKDIAVSGNKETDKIYYKHSGYMGGMKSLSFEELQAKKPGKVLELAVWGMLPKNKLKKEIIRNLRIFPGSEHDHIAQNPEIIKIES